MALLLHLSCMRHKAVPCSHCTGLKRVARHPAGESTYMRSISLTAGPRNPDACVLLVDITVMPSWPQTLQYFDDFGLTAARAWQVQRAPSCPLSPTRCGCACGVTVIAAEATGCDICLRHPLSQWSLLLQRDSASHSEDCAELRSGTSYPLTVLLNCEPSDRCAGAHLAFSLPPAQRSTLPHAILAHLCLRHHHCRHRVT